MCKIDCGWIQKNTIQQSKREERKHRKKQNRLRRGFPSQLRFLGVSAFCNQLGFVDGDYAQPDGAHAII